MSENITYWTTADPRVLDWCAANERAYFRWKTKVKDFQDAHDVRLLGGRNPFTGLTEACGVTGDTSRLPGRWTKPDSRGRCRPFANNMEGRTMLKSLDQPDVGAIPGLPRLMEYMTVEHGFVMVSVAFASGGRAWAKVGAGEPFDHKERAKAERDGGPVDRSIWTPVKEWEWLKAVDECDKKT